MDLHVFGIRHHGPGSARSLLRELQVLEPDVVLIEGPPDAENLLPLATLPGMIPPVALLIHAADEASRAVYYPFAEFSPEWQAIRFALGAGTPVRFIDLPQTHRMALIKEEEEKLRETVEVAMAAERGDEGEGDVVPGDSPEMGAADAGSADVPATADAPSPDADEAVVARVRRDPLGFLAEAAGYGDSERWWNDLVEERRESEGVFPAILEAMTALRDELPAEDDLMEKRREAWMRKCVRKAKKDGFEKIAVVCGAWHGPAIVKGPPIKDDNAILRGLPKLKVRAAWTPWTYGRLCSANGYGAGVDSPGWYDHLWNEPGDLATSWITRAARLLRTEDIDASSANVIESARLAESLAALRERPAPGMVEIREAMRSVLCFGDDAPMKIIASRLQVGQRLGEIPGEAPIVPLQRDLEARQKRLRMKPAAAEKSLDLDLRTDSGLGRSHLLHQLRLLEIPWGRTEREESGKRGTFHEYWTIEWKPEFAVAIIEASTFGNTVAEAATAKALRRGAETDSLAVLTELLDQALLAALPDAIDALMTRLRDASAQAGDVVTLLRAIPALARIARYGDVRGTASASILPVLTSFAVRIHIGLPAACGSLDDEAAAEMKDLLSEHHSALKLVEADDLLEACQQALRAIADRDSVHGMIAGRAVRLLLDDNALSPDESGRRMSLALSSGNDPAVAAAWLEGFLEGSGTLLVHDPALLPFINAWVCTLGDEHFKSVVPLLRRTFGAFPSPQRRMLGERLKRDGSGGGVTGASGDDSEPDLDHERAARVLPLLEKILGP